MKRYLVLDDGSYFEGEGFGASTISTGSLALFTGNFGYQEALTDPANAGKILVFSTPLVGASGINSIDYEAIDPQVKGIVVADLPLTHDHSEQAQNVNSYLAEKRIPGLYGVDTHALVHRLRAEKIIKASVMDTADQHAFDQIKALVLPKNKTRQVSTVNPYAAPNVGQTIAVIDLGLKHSLLRSLSLRRINAFTMPFDVAPQEIANVQPDGIIISNGPGDVQEVLPAIKEVFDRFYGKLPILAIGLGYLALSSYLDFELADLPLPFNGVNFPVISQNTQHIWQTAMNINALVLPIELDFDFSEKYFDLHTDMLAGFVSERHKVIAVAFNPEGAPGSFDATVVYDDFLRMLDENAEN